MITLGVALVAAYGVHLVFTACAFGWSGVGPAPRLGGSGRVSLSVRVGRWMTQRVAHFPTAAIGLFGLVSGVLSLLCHGLIEPRVDLSTQDWLLLAVMGLGPLGAAFFLWDKALKGGNAQHIGILSYLTPLCSTVLLMQVSHRPLNWNIAAAAALIIAAAVLGTRAR